MAEYDEETNTFTLSEEEWQHELHMMAVCAGDDLRKVAGGEVPREEADHMITVAEGLLQSSYPDDLAWVTECTAAFRAANRLPDPDRKAALAKAVEWADALPGFHIVGRYELTG